MKGTEAGRSWKKLEEAGRSWKKLEEAGRSWKKLEEAEKPGRVGEGHAEGMLNVHGAH
jgi:hypothetical protein